jgi:hypothetical protein
MSETALTRIDPQPSVEAMITLAIERGATVETLERLMAIRREVRAEQAKAAYDRAMAAFQAECPIIEKTKAVSTNSGKVAYKYAPIESIVAQVKGLLQKHGFSYSTKMELHDKGVKSTVRVTHEAGHSEESPMEVPFGEKTQIMSQSQVAAAATTFAKRYAFTNAFGILTGDEDIDGHTDSVKAPVPPAKEPEKPATKASKGATHQQLKPLPEPDEAARQRFIALLKPLGQAALDYAYEHGWLQKPEHDSPGEPLEVLDLKHVPRTKRQADAILFEIQARMDGQKPAGASGPPPDSAPPAKDAGKAAKRKESGQPEPAHHSEEWWNFPMPWGKNAGTPLGKLDKKYLFGLWCNYEVEKEFNGKPKKRETIEKDEYFREMLDQAGEEYEFEEPDNRD